MDRKVALCLCFRGEQDGEGPYAIFNAQAQAHSTIRNPTQQLLLKVREHQMQASPSTVDIQPLPKRKNNTKNAPVLCVQ